MVPQNNYGASPFSHQSRPIFKNCSTSMLYYIFGHRLAHVGTLLVVFGRFWRPLNSMFVALGTFEKDLFSSTPFLSAPEAAKHLQPTARHPRRKNSPFQGHVRNLAVGNLRTDARIISYYHICNCLHWIQIFVHS